MPPAEVIARRAGSGWLLEREGTPLVEEAVPDEELLERIEELVVVGWLDLADRISLVEPGRLAWVRIVDEFLAAAGPEEPADPFDALRAERYVGEERYV